MISPREIRIADYTYTLPEAQIARYPLEERDLSRLLILEKGELKMDVYRNLASHLLPGTALVFNNTRVVEARLLFKKPTGGQIEIFCLEPGPEYIDIASAMQQKAQVRWKCLIGGAGKWKHGQVLEKKLENTTLTAAIRSHLPDAYLIELSWDNPLSFADILHLAGQIPLPPYLKREPDPSDARRYQTVYAQAEGSVAAPTAGLHFSDQLLENLAEAGIHCRYITLHVGAGTFKPVKSDTMHDHIMHAEFIDVSLETIKGLSDESRIIAVGTTSLRTLESLYWMGVKVALNPALSPEELSIQQWEVYDQLQQHAMPRAEALRHLISYMHNRNMERIITRTQILILPGYQARMVSGIITNFHQPQSTLLLLIAALIGPQWKNMYQYALDQGFRFLSYGDGCLLKFDPPDEGAAR